MTRVVLATIEADGMTWVACVHPEDRAQVASGYTLLFIRDGIVGGTRKLAWRAPPELVSLMATGSQATVTARLLAEFRRAMAFGTRGHAGTAEVRVSVARHSPDIASCCVVARP
jgi:hypothetical protein